MKLQHQHQNQHQIQDELGIDSSLHIRSGEKCRLYSGSRRCHHDPTVVVTEQVAELNSLSLTVKRRTEYLPEMMRTITAPGYAPTVP
jgi:hypothetical protein